jgi:predicted site-specific integrase-resolvase
MYIVDLFFDDLTEKTALEEITEQPGQERVVVVYARVSANENRPNPDSQTENPIEDIIAGFDSILYSFCARLAKRKTEKFVKEDRERVTKQMEQITNKRNRQVNQLLSFLRH